MTNESDARVAGADDTLQRELAVEQAHVDRVYEALELATASARQVEREGRSLYQSSRSDFVREEDGTALFERDAFAYQAARRLAILDAEHEGLVFGRLDLSEPDTRYIGRIGVRDADYEPLVIDWRAPAAEAFYRATPTAPMGVIRRRVLRCRADRVVGIEDDLLDAETTTQLPVIGEGALMAALSRARGDAMRDIVATIQAEQDEAIRAPYQGVTTIAGGPGTGKTVVALHRAAFLLYTHRKRLQKGGVLVVGPSALFMNYIERVLPSLGEDAVTLRSVGQLASDVLRLSSDRTDEAEAATLKGSLRLLPVLRRVVDEPLPDAASLQLRVTVKGEVLTLDGRTTGRIRRHVLASHKVNRGRDAAQHALLNSLWDRYPDRDDMPRGQFDDLVTSQAAFTMFMHAWWPHLVATDVLARLGDRDGLDRWAPDLRDHEREALAASYAGVRDGTQGWSVADIALLDELVAMIGVPDPEPDEDHPLFIEGGDDVPELVSTADLLTFTRETDPDEDPQQTFSHVLVDEVQDITPMQWRMLRRRGPQASWTLVGDPAQSSYPHQDETRQAVRDLVGGAPHRRFRLSTNYRSPAEVFALAGRVIQTVAPDADLPDAVRSTGVEPLLATSSPDRWVEDAATLVGDLARDVPGTIGVIVSPGRMGDAEAALAGPWAAHADRVRLVTPLQSKGLEYDGVLVVAPDEIVAETPGGVHVLYVALTRPTQQLVTLDVGSSDWRAGLA